MLCVNQIQPSINNDLPQRLFLCLHSHILDLQSPSTSLYVCACVWLLVETYFPQNACIDGSQVDGILAIVIHTVNYLTERRVIFLIVRAAAGCLPGVFVKHKCLLEMAPFFFLKEIIVIQILSLLAIDTENKVK